MVWSVVVSMESEEKKPVLLSPTRSIKIVDLRVFDSLALGDQTLANRSGIQSGSKDKWLELLEPLVDVLVVLVVFKVELKNTPKPTMMIIVMIMRADTPRDIALFAFTNSNRIQK